MPFNYEIRTRYSETAQDGIIHHSSFVIYLEEARVEFMRTLGFDINALEKKKIFCPVIDLSLKYRKPLYSLETITISVAIASFSKVRFNLSYQIFKGGISVASGSSSHCFLNEAFKPIPIPAAILEMFNAIKQ